ncbi:MAG TPA: ABC transporter permease [Chitinophagales bacterium]|nr:ABC transporter permease [Chitinophagales bacterium]
MLQKIAVFFQIIGEGFAQALQALWGNPLRAFLSALGIAIGIFCVISVLMPIDSLEQSIRKSFSRLGSDLIFIHQFPWDGGHGRWWEYMKRPQPSYRDYLALRERANLTEDVAIRVVIQGQALKYRDNIIENAPLGAATQEFADIMRFEFESGRWFSSNESAVGNDVIVLGHRLAEELFPNITDPLGLQVRFMGQQLTLVGILKKEGKSLTGDGVDGIAFVPYNFARRYLDVDSEQLMPLIVARPKAGIPLSEVEDQLSHVLRTSRRLKPTAEDNFALNRSSLFDQFIASIFGVINAAGWLIGAFSILVGGFGIANIMFVSVRERTGQIGIKKSLGARNYFILLEFLIEAVFLSIIGGIAGLFFVQGLAWLGNTMIDSFTLILSSKNVITALILSTAIGVVSGIVPAIQAARMNPVDAIRQN